ncbi:hypothetical protein TSAR_014984 [Trichomalopsis sarcophagae]|uniref:GDP-D-glucose phosphorylase 1 n=1 Tax=Trichomalopsis sarcophagae TaxID=543379 RepID=A0A232EYD1_9HYME|nr:hypothetical protein TSAR_014984 [Trichomalopsis sarcophagae]
MEKNNIQIFSYNEEDFHYKVKDENVDSKFDIALKEKWKRAEEDDILRYSVKAQQFKILEGKYGFYAQLNTERATMRRKPEEIQSMQQPFDPNRFNFTRISHKEILLDIGNSDGDDIVAVNVSPILWSHCLLIPQRFSCLPQQATLYSFQKAIDILLLSNSENMRVLFNSLCANASVNHLHWHLYYLNHRVILEYIPLQYFIGSIFILEDYPAKGFCIKFSSFQNITEYTLYAYKIISCLQNNQLAHNIYITRAKADANSKECDDIRTYIWARTSSYGAKNTKDFVIAACEIFGHLPIRSEEAYTRINEEYVSECLEDTTLSAFLVAKEKIKKTLEDDVEKSVDASSSKT